MPHENVELVSTFMAAANQRDFETMDGLISDELVFHSTFAASEGRVFAGHAGLREYFTSLEGSFDPLELPVEEIIDAGEDQVVLLVRVCGRGKASGIPIDHRFGQVWKIVDGLVRRIVSYSDPSDALNAVRLRE